MDDDLLNRIRGTVRTVPDFPIEGIMFRDITPVLGEPGLLSSITDRFAEDLQKLGWEPEAVVGPEARGFIFGPLLSNVLEIHEDAIQPGQRVVIIDDLLATGGTISACASLCEELGAEVLGALFLIELDGLGAREAIEPVKAHALLSYPA